MEKPLSARFFQQVILGIVFPPAILLLDFGLGEETSFHSSKESEGSGNKDDDDAKSGKVGGARGAPRSFLL